jgi:hypothetical protein
MAAPIKADALITDHHSGLPVSADRGVVGFGLGSFDSEPPRPRCNERPTADNSSKQPYAYCDPGAPASFLTASWIGLPPVTYTLSRCAL